MGQRDVITGLLNDLIKINHDRTAGYEKAAALARGLEPDIKNIFLHMGSESRKYAGDLRDAVRRLDGIPGEGTTLSGKFYLFWMELKSGLPGDNTASLLRSCEHEENATQKVYAAVLEQHWWMPKEIYDMIANQQHALQSSLDLIKRYRDMHNS